MELPRERREVRRGTRVHTVRVHDRELLGLDELAGFGIRIAHRFRGARGTDVKDLVFAGLHAARGARKRELSTPFGDDDENERARCTLGDGVEIELDERLVRLDAVAVFDQRFEAFAFELDRIEPDVKEDRDAPVGPHRERVLRAVDLHDSTAARGPEDRRRRIDRHAVAHHLSGEDGIGHVVERDQYTIHRSQ